MTSIIFFVTYFRIIKYIYCVVHTVTNAYVFHLHQSS